MPSIQNPKSKIQNFLIGQHYLVGGVNSPVRAFRHVGEDPLVLTQSRGSSVMDHTGRAYLDFIMGWGALILGHQPPAVMRAVRAALDRGTLLGLTSPMEIELARLIVNAVPSVERVRFTTSGTEACMTAIKLARAVTGRDTILVFEGGYHGHSDSLMARRSAGIPKGVARDTISAPYNDAAQCRELIRRHATELACAIVEPVAANMGVVSPAPGFLAQLREETTRAGALLIADEVVTGFRLRYGAAQDQLGFTADLTTFGKIIGGGFPIGALGGPERLMRRLAPEGDVYHGGTFAGHPLSMAAGVATLNALRAHPPYRTLDARGAQLADGLQDAARAHRVPLQINRIGSMMTLFFSERPVKDWSGAQTSRRESFAKFFRQMRASGILLPPSPYEVLFLSSAHTPAQIAQCLKAAERALAHIR